MEAFLNLSYIYYTTTMYQKQQAGLQQHTPTTLRSWQQVKESTGKLQRAADRIVSWTQKWRIKLKEDKSVYIKFTNKNIKQQPIFVNGVQIQPTNTAEYLGMTDAKLRWKEHIKKKQKELQIKITKMYWLLGRRSQL
jgi:hypothetical protein